METELFFSMPLADGCFLPCDSRRLPASVSHSCVPTHTHSIFKHSFKNARSKLGPSRRSRSYITTNDHCCISLSSLVAIKSVGGESCGGGVVCHAQPHSLSRREGEM